ncbi:MAG: metallophosphoesterase family protein [Thermoguttaceae bacterium]
MLCRFLHASDFGLDLPIEGCLEFPAEIETRFQAASRRAVERVVDTAILEEVDFVVLSGGLVQLAKTGPSTAVFLVRQLERLASARIPVYWGGGPDDTPDDWPSTFVLPPNVHRFPSDTVQEFIVEREHVPIARVVGMSRNHRDVAIKVGGFTPDVAGLFTVGVVNGEIDPQVFDAAAIPFWAVGGRGQRSLQRGIARRAAAHSDTDRGSERRAANAFVAVPYIVHYAGPPLARSPRALGDYGATLVEVEQGVQPRLTLIPTSPLRWVVEKIALTDGMTETLLAQAISEQIERLTDTARRTETDTIVSLRLTETRADHPLFPKLRSATAINELLSRWRIVPDDLTKPLCWILSLELETPATLPQPLYDQQTILGDYLRLVRHHQTHPEIPLDLSSFLPPGLLSQPIASRLLLTERPTAATIGEEEPQTSEDGAATNVVDVDDSSHPLNQTAAQQRRQTQLLRDAALLGSELLGQTRPGF